VVLGIIFNRYIEDMVISGTPGDRAKIAGFLENMAKAKDQGVVVLLRIEILPTLWKTQRNIDTYYVLGVFRDGNSASLDMAGPEARASNYVAF
jgi:hypothetical protein